MVDGAADVGHLDREQALAKLEESRAAHLAALAALAADVSDSAPHLPPPNAMPSLGGWSESAVVLECGKGHAMPAVDVLSRAVIHDAVPCPQCVHDGVVPPFCFNRRYCLLYFDEDNSGRPPSYRTPRDSPQTPHPN